MELRDYQAESIASVFAYFQTGGENPLVVAPTGSGKSVIIAGLLRRALEGWPDTRVVMATHRKELIAQNHQALMRIWPEAPAGIHSAGLHLRQIRQITFAGVQTVARRAKSFGYVDFMLIDEAHLLSPNAGTQYQRFIEDLKAVNPNLRVIGFTATPYRLDSGHLVEGRGALFDGIAYDISVGMLVRRGFLAPLIGKPLETRFDTRGLHTRGGEFVEAEMAERFDRDEVTQEAVREIVHFGRERRAWMVFCVNVAHALNVRDALRRRGVAAEAVTGETSNRDAILNAFKEGRLQALTSVGVLTTGFDAPRVDLLAFLRPTKSRALYMQCCGRGMRIAEGKKNCIVLDFAGNVEQHGPVDAETPKPRKWNEASEPGENLPPLKACPACDAPLLIAARECAECGHVFTFADRQRHDRTASTAAVMNLTAADTFWPVQDAEWSRHVGRQSRLPSLRVDLLVQGKLVSEYLPFGRDDVGSRRMAARWWLQHGGAEPIPESVEEALERQSETEPPSSVALVREGQYQRVKGRRFKAAPEDVVEEFLKC